MFNLAMLDVVIGAVFYFLFASLICSAVREMFESLLGQRATMLEKALREILDDATPIKDGKKSTLVQFFQHPMIDSLFQGDYTPTFVYKFPVIGWILAGLRQYGNHRRLPAYIPKENFAAAVLDIFSGPDATSAAPAPANANAVAPDVKARRLAAIRKTAEGAIARATFDAPKDNTTPAQTTNTAQQDGAATAPTTDGGQEDDRTDLPPSERLAKAILWALDNSNGDLVAARKQLENWYDSSMDRVSGWYKRQTQWMLFLIGAAAAVALNLNTIMVIERLYYDDEFRRAAVEDATHAVTDPALLAKIEIERAKIGAAQAAENPAPTDTSKPATNSKPVAAPSAPKQEPAPSQPSAGDGAQQTRARMLPF
jgi:hypothetical protein